MKKIYLHPSRITSLKPGEQFDIDSGLGGSFTVRFDGWRCGKSMADFTITSSCYPPDGWRGVKHTYPTAQLTTTLYQLVDESPFMDYGRAAFAALKHLGYADTSPEVITLKRRTTPQPKTNVRKS